MVVDVEGIIRSIGRGDVSGVQSRLQEFNAEVLETRSCCSFCSLYDEGRVCLAAVLVRFIRTGIPCHLLQVALRSLRILSRDKRVLGPLVTDDALLTLAEAAGLSATRPNDDAGEPDSDFYDNVISSLAREVATPPLICGLRERLSSSAASSAPSSVHFYQLRLTFLVTALRPELTVSQFLPQDGGVSILSAALEGCLEVRWKEQYECVLDPAAPPISLEASQRIVEILKILFNITHRSHRQVDAALYRHLVAILRLCLMRKCVTPEDTDELQGHTVNLLSALPLQCLDVLLTVPLEPDSEQCRGVNMDCVQILLLFMERRLESGDKIKEKVTPILNLLTESCRAHKETRHFIRTYVLPPLRDVSQRPEEGCTVKGRLIRLMTHLDTDLKHCAADLIFVLCKENVRRFVKYTGYGNAAGLLATRGLLAGPTSRTSCGETPYSSDSDSDTEEYRRVKDRVNPVTGRVEAELPDPMEGMTEEEKEEEAKRLIKIFNKLSRDNIIRPMGVDADGKLVPMAGLRDESLTEESASDSDTAEVEENQ
uniref:Synembryn n=1 Tax=Hippocampus comes TaxID=109280 RepID=A0A3Q2YPB0_HIPCM